MAEPKQPNLADLFPVALDAIRDRLDLFAKARRLEHQAGDVNTELAHEEREWVQMALKAVMALSLPGSKSL